MKPQIPLRNALADKKLLGDALAGDRRYCLPPWASPSKPTSWSTTR
jgi:hypothetical protein